jgi:hypothetical protein|tara:strand:- start:4 stop:231 length:228 start_codon:yes stop_codon:yes gene_type:complete
MKLFQIHTGFYDSTDASGGFYEGHTNFFVCADDAVSARKKVKLKKEYKKYKMHIDGVQVITEVDGFKISISRKKS